MTPEERERFPEYAKYYDKAKEGDSQIIGAFIEWLGWSKYVITEYRTVVDTGIRIDGTEYDYEVERQVMVSKSVEEWLCEFYEIDYKQAMVEKEEMLRELLAALNG